MIGKYFRSYQNRWNRRLEEGHGEKVTRVRWNLPLKDRCKVNKDGMCIHEGIAGCGGVICGDTSECISGFSQKLPGKNAYTAKIWGIIKGLEKCWELGLKKVEVESDAIDIVQQIGNRGTVEENLELTYKVQDLLARDWQIKWKHIYREGNRCADKLAKISMDQPQDLTYWEMPPSEILQEDAEGVEIPRGLFV